jgi:hypothetical protein
VLDFCACNSIFNGVEKRELARRRAARSSSENEASIEVAAMKTRVCRRFSSLIRFILFSTSIERLFNEQKITNGDMRMAWNRNRKRSSNGGFHVISQ